jgi:drug/metabolite transporter (DMT)-like permease
VAGASQTRAYVALVLIATLWGSFPATAKLALLDFPPFFLAAVRCSLASAFLVTRLARGGGDAIRAVGRADLLAFLVLGLAGIWGSTQMTYVAIYYTTAANAVILQAATPIIVALAARLYLGERLGRRQWLGVSVSGLGVLFVITDGRLAALRPADLRPGDFIVLASLCGWSAYTVYGKRVLSTTSPALATTAAYVLGTLLILPTMLFAAPFFPAPRIGSPTAWAVVFYQGLLGAVAHVWWYRAVDVVGPSRAAIFMNLQPVIGVALAAVLVAERLGPWEILGGALVLGGVGLTTIHIRRSRPGPR